MDLTDDELRITKKQKEYYTKMNDEIIFLKLVIEEMAEDLVTPINNKNWIINYYKEKAENRKRINTDLKDMLD